MEGERPLPLYCIYIAHEGEDSWANEVETRMRTSAGHVLQDVDAIRRVGSPAEGGRLDAHTVVVVLATRRTVASTRITDELAIARAESFAVLPVVQKDERVEDVLPESIRTLNAVRWNNNVDVGLVILRLLGLVERDRRLFLSYRRAETSALAIQLRRALSERQYDVFLDRFSVPPAADFRERIDIELADKAFVLLLESESAIGSEWVDHEVTYALAHHLGLLVLNIPGTTDEQQFKIVDEAFRIRLAQTDFDNGSPGHLAAPALGRVLQEVEATYAREMRRRRLQLFGAMTDFITAAGYEWHALEQWSILARRWTEDEGAVLTVTPRAPAPRDLRDVDQLARRVAPRGAKQPHAIVVHDARDEDAESRALVDWIIAGRTIATIRVEGLPALLAK